MVRVIAELSVHTPTASSRDRYKYRYGCSGRGVNPGHVIYKRPALSLGENITQKQSEKQPLLMCGGDTEDHILNNGYHLHTINGHINNINETSDRISAMVEMRRNIRETQQMREINEKEKEKEINHKLGKIIYRSRTGELFIAQHSVQMTIVFVFDKKTGQSIQSQTQKVVWNDKVFETKQDWFREMARSCIDRAEETMKRQ